MTPEQKLRLCELIWPRQEWELQHSRPARRCQRREHVSGWLTSDLTSNEAVGAMVAWLMERFADDPALIAHDIEDALKDVDWRAALARLVLEVAGDE
jgi:hypothetical protein